MLSASWSSEPPAYLKKNNNKREERISHWVQSFLGCSSVVHLSAISWQKSTVTVWLHCSKEGLFSKHVPWSSSLCIFPAVHTSALWPHGHWSWLWDPACSEQHCTPSPVHCVFWNFRSNPSGGEMVLPVAAGSSTGRKTGQNVCICSGLNWTSPHTSWQRHEKLSHSSPMQAFSWFLSVSNFSFSQSCVKVQKRFGYRP